MRREKFPTLKGAVSSEGAPPHYTKDVPRPRYRVVAWAEDVKISTPKGRVGLVEKIGVSDFSPLSLPYQSPNHQDKRRERESPA